MEIVINVLRGVAIGLANIIPGVSGGTMALLLGIYERLIRAVHNIGPTTLKAVFGGKQGLVDEFRRVDGLFLGALGVGAMAAIVAVAKVMAYLITEQHDPTYGFFFGLVLLSVVVPYRMIRKKTFGTVVSALVAVAVVVSLSLAMSGEERLASETKKAALKAERAKAKAAARAGGDVEAAKPAEHRVSQDPRNMLFFFAAGAIAISAMILPGISGSFLLLLLGVYFDILICINDRQVVMLGIFAAGCVLGLLAFTRLLNFLLERVHDQTLAFLLGLVVGSLYAIWPFKTFAMVGERRIDLAHAWPTTFGSNELLTFGTIVAGCAVVGAFMWVEARTEKAEAA